MSIVTIISDAKCKHCKYFKLRALFNRDNTISKIKRHFCVNANSKRFTEQITLKTLACDKLEL